MTNNRRLSAIEEKVAARCTRPLGMDEALKTAQVWKSLNDRPSETKREELPNQPVCAISQCISTRELDSVLRGSEGETTNASWWSSNQIRNDASSAPERRC